MAKDLDDQVEAFRTLFETVVRDRSKNHPVTAPTSAGHAHQFSSYTALLD
jgi:hypothetical protein